MKMSKIITLSNIFSGMGGIDLSQISNMLAGIDLNKLDLNNLDLNNLDLNNLDNNPFSEMINSISNNNSVESNDVEFKHTDPKERTHSIVKNLEDEDMGQLIYILAHLVDDRKLEILNKIVEENSN